MHRVPGGPEIGMVTIPPMANFGIYRFQELDRIFQCQTCFSHLIAGLHEEERCLTSSCCWSFPPHCWQLCRSIHRFRPALRHAPNSCRPDLPLQRSEHRVAGAGGLWPPRCSRSALPSHFEIDDAFATAAEMGAKVVRAQTMGDTVGCPQCIEPEQGKFNEAAFQSSDYALAAATSTGCA